MKRMGRKCFSPGLCLLITAMFAALSLLSGCGGGGTTPVITPVITIADSDVIVNSGMTSGGVARESTQTMTGSLPNPTGSTDTYQGKAYLVLNGDKIPLSVTQATSASSVTQSRKIYKEGKEYYLNGTDKIAAALPLLQAKAAAPVTWVYSVTFSINSGPNTVSVEVYDENNTIYARMGPWNVVGVIMPTSLVVTLWWNTNGTDIDLHMSPDNGTTHCYYRSLTAGEMKLDYDNTSGYGPEHITIDNATGTNTYKIKVYYYADHNTNDPPSTTPTTAHITATVNGITKLSTSSTLSTASTSSGWGSGAHIWDAGEVEVVAPSRYAVTLDDPDLSSFPTVKVTATVTDPNNSTEPKVKGLAASNFYVINAGKSMSPVSVAAAENVYTLTFTDIVAGKRDLFVYVSVPALAEAPMKGGLSNTKTYGTNYALLAGLNEYPAADMATAAVSWISAAPDYVQVTVPSTRIPDGAGDFSFTFTDTQGVRSAVSVTPTSITPAPAAGVTSYRLDFTQPANYADYESLRVSYKKQIWLSWCVKDTTDLKAALLAKGTGMSNTSWESANITTYTNSAATKTAILTKIETIAGSMQKYDMLLFHFSGHGSGMPIAGNAAQYLCAYEDNAWITVNDLKAKLDLVPNPGGGIANTFILMDACHSGNFIGKELARGVDTGTGAEKLLKYRPFMPQAQEAAFDPRMIEFRDLTALSNTFVMAAQTGSSVSWDDGGLQNGVFTHYLVEGISVSGKYLSNASGNSNRDVWITGEEAFSYLDPLTQARVSVANGYAAGEFQHPQAWDESRILSPLLIYNW